MNVPLNKYKNRNDIVLMSGFSRKFLIILLHFYFFFFRKYTACVDQRRREGSGPSPLENSNFLNLHVMFSTFLIFFQEVRVGTGGPDPFPRKIQFYQIYTVKSPKKTSGSAHAQVLVYKEGKIFIPFFNLPKNQITCTCNNRRHTVLSIINFLYECQCKWGCMENLATWSVHYSYRQYKQYMLFEFMTIN